MYICNLVVYVTVFEIIDTFETYRSCIYFQVAEYINKNNPEIYQEAEKYLNIETFKKLKSAHKNMHSVQDNSTSSPLHSMSVASEALALQQSVIGIFFIYT